MSTVLETNQSAQIVLPKIKGSEEIFYPESHEDDMGESSLHYKLVSYIFNALSLFLANQTNVFIAANMNLYYQKGNAKKYYTPDVFVAFGVESRDRQVYKLWEESVFPQVVFEIASERTWKNDVSDKYDFYQQRGAEEYYLLDPERRFLPSPLMAYKRKDGRLRLAIAKKNRVLSETLGLEIVDTGEMIRLFNPKQKEFLRTPEELQEEIERLRIELARLKTKK
jgi:Uma2 family endonuclease